MNLAPVVGKNLLLRFHIVTMVIYSLFKQLLSDENDEFPIKDSYLFDYSSV